MAWVHRGWPVSRKRTGVAAAAAAALVGAWLGFHGTGGRSGLVTAIAGGTAGANVALILLDIAREQSVRPRSARTAPSDTAAVSSSELGG